MLVMVYYLRICFQILILLKKWHLEQINYDVINPGIAPYLYNIVQEKISSCDCFVVAFDESLNDVSQLSQMGTFFRFWYSASNIGKVRYWNSGHSLTFWNILIDESLL